MTTYGRLVLPSTDPVFTSAGLLNVGATLTVYLTGTDTLATLYSDPTGDTGITNPQVSDAAGRFYDQSTQICADQSQAYDCNLVLTDGETFFYTQQYVLGAAPTITGYAPINSPVFTGNPQAPTPAANDNSASIATTAFVQAALALLNVFPPGMVGMFGMSSVPTGWLPFSTTPVSRTTYAALFGAVGTTYGVGDGTTTFGIPPPGYFGRACNTTSSGPDPSRAVGSIQTDAFQGHFHSPLAGSGFYGMPTGGGVIQEGSGNSTILNATTGASVTDGTNGTPRTTTETRPVNIAFVWCIKT